MTTTDKTAIEQCSLCEKWVLEGDTPRVHQGNVVCGECWDRENEAGISGWLVLPAIGLVLGAISQLSVIGQFRVMFYTISHAGRLAEFPNAAPAESIAIAIGGIMFVVMAGACWCFFRRYKFVPRMMVGLYIAETIEDIFLIAIQTLMLPGAFDLNSTWAATLAIYWAIRLAWIIYFLRSRRVAATFTY